MQNSLVATVIYFFWNYVGGSTSQKFGYDFCVEGMLHPLEISENTTQWIDFISILEQQLSKCPMSKDIKHDSIFVHHTSNLQSSPVLFKFSEKRGKQHVQNTEIIHENSPISTLYKLCNKHYLPVNFHTDSEGPAHKKVFRTTCTVGKHITYGQGSTKSAAKQNAASEMLKLVVDLHRTEPFQTKKVNKKQKFIKYSPDTNPIPYLQEWSRHRVQYTEADHDDNLFLINCILDDLQAIGEGRSKKIAKRMAAAEMIKLLKEQGKLQTNQISSEIHTPETRHPQIASFDNSEETINNLEKMEVYKPSKLNSYHKSDMSDEKAGDMRDLLKAVCEEMAYQVSYRDVVNGKAHLSFVSVSYGNSVTCYGFGLDIEHSQQEAARTVIQHLSKVLHVDRVDIALKLTGSDYISQDSSGYFYLETRK